MTVEALVLRGIVKVAVEDVVKLNLEGTCQVGHLMP